MTQWVSSYGISPEYFPNVIKRTVELGYFKTTAEAEANFNYRNYAIQGAIGAFFMGVVTTAIAMIFIRSKNTQQQQQWTFKYQMFFHLQAAIIYTRYHCLFH